MGDKKNTVLLTVIAVATLLVAVVGSTFAFFAVQETTTANVSVKAETADAADVFSATGAGQLSLTVNNDAMMEDNGGKADAVVTDTDSSMVITLTAGSGKATCDYDIVWEDTSTEAYKRSTYTENGETKTVTGNEYTIYGTNGTDTISEINVSDIAADGKLGSFQITNTAGSETTSQTWTFTARFYNLAVNQNAQINKTFTSNIKVAAVDCENEATN